MMLVPAASIQQRLHYRHIATFCSRNERPAVEDICHDDVGAGCRQSLHRRRAAVACCCIERWTVQCVDLGASLKQRLHRRRAAVEGCGQQSRSLAIVCAVDARQAVDARSSGTLPWRAASTTACHAR